MLSSYDFQYVLPDIMWSGPDIMWSGPVIIWSGPDKKLFKKIKSFSMSVVGHPYDFQLLLSVKFSIYKFWFWPLVMTSSTTSGYNGKVIKLHTKWCFWLQCLDSRSGWHTQRAELIELYIVFVYPKWCFLSDWGLHYQIPMKTVVVIWGKRTDRWWRIQQCCQIKPEAVAWGRFLWVCGPAVSVKW